MSTFPSCQAHITKATLPITLHLVGIMNELEVAHNFTKFWVVWCLIVFWFAQTFSHFPYFPHSFLFFYFFTIWLFEVWQEPFQNSKYLLKYLWNILRANWKVLSSNFMFPLYLLLWMLWNQTLFYGIEVHPWKFMKF